MAAWQHGNDSNDHLPGIEGQWMALTGDCVSPGKLSRLVIGMRRQQKSICRCARATVPSVARNARLIPSSDVALVKLLKILMPVLKLVPQRVQQDMASRAKY